MKEMQWRSLSGTDKDEKILFINDSKFGWVPYYKSSLKVPDYNIPGGSKGYSTMQRLLKLGYTIIPSN